MKKSSTLNACALACALMSVLPGVGLGGELVDEVNTEIGNISHMLVPTFPATQLPNAMYRFTPPAESFKTDRVGAFPLQIVSHRDRGVFLVNPYTGSRDNVFGAWRGTWDQQHARPERFEVFFDEDWTAMELAPAERGGVAAFRFEREGVHALVFRPAASGGAFSFSDGVLAARDVYKGMNVHLYGKFNVEPESVKLKDNALAVFFDTKAGTAVRFSFAISYHDPRQAARNFAREVEGETVRSLASAARSAWNRTLGKIEVEGGTAAERRVFYTALWRTYERMVNTTEEGRYIGYDRKIRDAGEFDYYNDDWTWDTYRAAHPLMCILEPKAEAAKLVSYLRMARQNPEGWLPTFPHVASDRHGMNGFHVPVLFLDALVKGVKGPDWAAAYRASVHTERTASRLPWFRGPACSLDAFYEKHGYFPALHPAEDGGWVKDPEWPEAAKHDERRQSVAVTLAYSFDCWCIAELAKRFGTEAEVEEYTRKSRNYLNLWNSKTGFFHPKDKDGRFIMPFDYRYSGGQGARDYYDENNAWTYIWDIQHALPELVGLLGGGEKTCAKLDRMFNEPYGRARWRFYNVLPDSTGDMGMFSMGNEPSFHIPYMYNYAGRPWKTQKTVRKVLRAWFRDDLMGMCGDEDGGGMSAFAVFSMMGFYPVTPGTAEYQWGSPVFRKVTIHQDNGRDFVIESPDASQDVKYIHSLTIDGVAADETTVLSHADVVRGARVRVKMSSRPSTSWGVAR